MQVYGKNTKIIPCNNFIKERIMKLFFEKKAVLIVCVVTLAVICGLLIAVGAITANSAEIDTSYLGEDYAPKAQVSASDNGALAGLVTDGSYNTYWQGERRNSYIEFYFENPVTFNTVSINETGFSISDFCIEVSDDGKTFRNVYRQDRIERHRLCALTDSVTAKYVRVRINESDATPRINDIGIYNVESEVKDDFQVVGYQPLSDLMNKVNEYNLAGTELTYEQKYELFDGDKYDLYNVINLISGIGWNTEAELYYLYEYEGIEGSEEEKQQQKQQLFEQTLSIMREVIGDRNVRINITMANPRPNEDCVNSMIGDKKDKLAVNMIDFIEKYSLQGIDIDWEYPITQQEFDAYNAFLVRLKKEMNDRSGDYELSLAVSTWAFRYSDEAVQSIDRLQLMGYDIVDHNGDHGGFYGAAVQAVEYCLDYGFKREQINLGMGFYGTYLQGNMEQYGFTAIVDGQYEWSRNIYDCVWQDKVVSDVYFNGGQMVYDKTCYAVYQGLGGTMVWHANIDKPGMGEDTLAYAMDKALSDVRNWR